ncbi:MAG: hypothetical protein AAF432_05595 [Planctomycetota bacterium]
MLRRRSTTNDRRGFVVALMTSAALCCTLTGCTTSARSQYEVTLNTVLTSTEVPNTQVASAFGLDQPAMASGTMLADAR